ncbi:MOSC domain-containing protein [Microbacterium stercoris]|uniref:MOSC domain-containing protein n=1 Tax=Microbacterium stercoris TaxID=2820289 RepID=A0A939QJR1_9MICO|nr:MOSC domain-containing protein [Microbacterium stercoris]MBO3664188.1 MOSC domain-containing protein [Microbacterium stercoris]
MPFVEQLHRFPMKGFTEERHDALTVRPDGRIEGDRVLAFRFADATEPEVRDGLEYWAKTRGLALVDFPSLARIQLSWDGSVVRMSLDGAVLAEERLDPDGRARLVDAVTEFLLSGPEAKLLRRPGRLPLVLVGDGSTSRFQDRSRGFISLHGSASVAAVDALVDAPIDSRRFRSNVVVGGMDAWAELEWAGRVTIGDVVFDVQKPIGRCLAVHANPDTGQRDARVLQTLTRDVGQAEPTLGVLLLPAAGGGVIRVGDEVRFD